MTQAGIGQGGAQWMKAGTGIVHDELPIPHNNQFEGLQFWINLLPQGKAQAPDYRAVQAAQLPWFDYQGSQCKVIVGELAAMSSPIPTEQRLFLYHLQLQTQIILTLEAGDEIAVFSPKASIVLNDETLPAGLHILQPPLPSLTIKTSDEKMNDVFVFGGQPYNQPIVSGGPFMTNTQAQLQQAYLDFQAGKYGQMDYSGYESE